MSPALRSPSFDRGLRAAPGTGQSGGARVVAGDTAVLGATGAHGPAGDGGKAYVFEEQGRVWVETRTLTAGDGERVEDFGRELVLDGDTLAVGAPWDDVGAQGVVLCGPPRLTHAVAVAGLVQ